MRHPGLGVMIGMLAGNASTVKAITASLNKTITDLTLADEALHFVFDDGSKMKIYDDGQSCCEARYMKTDDRLYEFVGSRFLGAEIKSAPNVQDGSGEDHEIQFLDVKTSKGVFQMASHNEHNGYYGGFLIAAEME